MNAASTTAVAVPLCHESCHVKFLDISKITLFLTLMALTSIKTDNEKLEIINQLLLPHSIQYETIETIQQAHEAIKTMKVCQHPTNSLEMPS